MDTQRDPQFHPEDRRTALSLPDFAQQNQITEERVWEMIEEGSVAARFVNDSILILRDGEPTFETGYDLPEIGVREPLSPEEQPANSNVFLEEALQGREDSQDVLLFAQDALARTEELSRQLLATKDELIRMKDEKIAWLTEAIQKKDREIRLLNQRLEDYATLRKFENG